MVSFHINGNILLWLLPYIIIFDFASSSVQVSGSKFYYLKNAAVLLEMALVNWTISQLMRRGFTPLTTPEIVRSSIVEKCGFQPRGENTQVCWYLTIFSFSLRSRFVEIILWLVTASSEHELERMAVVHFLFRLSYFVFRLN